MGLPNVELHNIVNNLYARFNEPSPIVNKGDGVVELRSDYPLKFVVGPLLRWHYIARGYEIRTFGERSEDIAIKPIYKP